jgi:PAS domain S-box-containing protein
MAEYEKMTRNKLIEILQSFQSAEKMSQHEQERLLHELQVHQIELEMQNQELQATQRQLEEITHIYADLYDFAPVGYISFNDLGFILEINLTGATILGQERPDLINKPFASFVLSSDLAKFRDHLWNCRQTKEKITTQINLISKAGGLIGVELSSIAVYDNIRQITLCRTAFSDITERQLAEQALRISEEKLHLALDAAQLGVWEWDLAGEELICSERCKAFFAFAPDAVVTYQRFLETVHPEDRVRISGGLQEVLEYQKEYNIEVRVLWPDGLLHWVALIGRCIYDAGNQAIGMSGIAQDITIRKQDEEKLLASERELLKVTLNSLGEGVVAVDQAEKIILINETAAKLTGYSQAEALGQPLNKIFYIMDDRTSEPIDKVSSGTVFNHLILATRDLQEVAVSLSSAPIKSTDDQIIGTVIIIQDITEKQKTEQELLKTAKLESLGILAGGVAHDFNNILAGILANLQLAAVKLKKHQDISKHMESTIEITRKASELTKQLLTFAKGGNPVKKSATITNLVMDTVQFTLSGSKVKAEFHMPEDLWTVDIDEGQITQVINNLTINAEQAMPTGGILEIYGENVVLEAASQYNPGQYVKLTVKDHGIGIPEEIIPKIFDPFFTTKKTGNGLGLSTSYSIIKKHDGYLDVKSVPGIGTTFYILLPVSLKELALAESKIEIAVSGEAKILLMDDEEPIRTVGGEMLFYYGYQVTLARDGKEAIDLYKKAQKAGEPFELVIMDLTVPGGLGGIETMAVLRQIDPGAKAIISSGYASDPVMSDYKRYGFSGVVIKPYKFDELIEVLNQVLERKQLPLDLTY